MPKGVACYFGQLEPLIGTRVTIDKVTLPKVIRGERLKPTDPHFRQNKDGLLEVYGPFQTKVIRPWRSPPEVLWTALPGQVLVPKRRKATPGEIKLIKAGSGLVEDWEVKRERGFFTVEIVEKFEGKDGVFDLIDQLELHIWASLVGSVAEEKTGLSVSYGDRQQMEQMIQALDLIRLWLMQETARLHGTIDLAQIQIDRIAQDLEGVRAPTKVRAHDLLTSIAEQRDQEDLLALILGAQKTLASRRQEDIQMAMACAVRARRILNHTVRRIDSGVRQGFDGLVDCREKLLSPRKKGLTRKQLDQIAQRLAGIYAHLVRVAVFDPWYHRVHIREVAVLRNSLTRAIDFGARGLRNDANKAMGKLRALTQRAI